MGLEDERASKSIENRSMASLDRVKALKELDEMDDDTVIKYMNLIMQFEEMNRLQENEVKSDDVMISENNMQQ
jgi:hypothetical protein